MLVGVKAIDAKDLESVQRIIIITDDYHLCKYFTTYKQLVFILPQQTLLL